MNSRTASRPSASPESTAPWPHGRPRPRPLSAEAVNYQVGKGFRIPRTPGRPGTSESTGRHRSHGRERPRPRSRCRHQAAPPPADRWPVVGGPGWHPARLAESGSAEDGRTVEVNEMTSDAASYVLAYDLDAWPEDRAGAASSAAGSGGGSGSCRVAGKVPLRPATRNRRVTSQHLVSGNPWGLRFLPQ